MTAALQNVRKQSKSTEFGAKFQVAPCAKTSNYRHFMDKVKGKSELSKRLVENIAEKGPGAIVGFVPTMGALHAGHTALMDAARRECDVVVVSVFVNPTQFNDPRDLELYPRTPEADAERVASTGADVLWMPEVDDVYGGSVTKVPVDVGPATSVLEAARRPGHFDGVVAVVGRLLAAVRPHRLYLGEKDLQQVAVLRAWARTAHPEVEIRVCPTEREPDGLARSSRNLRLSGADRQIALHLSRALFSCASRVSADGDVAAAIADGRAQLQQVDGLELEYLEVVNGDTFLPGSGVADAPVYAVVAGRVGGVRLIDALRLA
jgi:pantoate--beta-alanine ligase